MSDATPTPAAVSRPTASRPYEEVLADAIRVLSEACRLNRPVLEPTQDQHAVGDEGGDVVSKPARRVREVWVDCGRREPADFAEFVALALAGAAANAGGVEAVLAGRPGSWEADNVRQLIHGTVGYDDDVLLEHRTEPVVVRVLVDEILTDLGARARYDEAEAAIRRRYEELDVDAPDREQQLDAIGAAEVRLEEDRQRAWAAFGAAVKDHIEVTAVGIAGLRVPVHVVVDLYAVRSPEEAMLDEGGIAGRLLQDARTAVLLLDGHTSI